MKNEDYALKLALSREVRELCELRRQLLGFPSPGRRRDEDPRVLDARAHVIDALGEHEPPVSAQCQTPVSDTTPSRDDHAVSDSSV